MEPQMQHQELQKCITEHHTASDRERMSKLQRAAPRTGRDEGHEQPTVTGRGGCDRQAGQRRAATGGSATAEAAATGGRPDEDDAAAAVPRGSSGDDWAPSICGRESQIEARRHSICARDDESRPGGGRRSRTDGCDLRTNGGCCCCCCCDSTGKENGLGA